MDCPKASQHTEYAHVDLGDDQWAHLRRKLTHERAQRIQVMQLAANYETAGARQMTMALIQSTLTAAPEEWRKEHLESVMATLERFLDQYETDHELALMQPKARQAMAQARIDLFATYGTEFFVEGSWGEQWPPVDGVVADLVEFKARDAWTEWQTEVGARLKAVGSPSD